MSNIKIRLPKQPADTEIFICVNPIFDRTRTIRCDIRIHRPDVEMDALYHLGGDGYPIGFENWEEFPYLPYLTMEDNPQTDEVANLIQNAMDRVRELYLKECYGDGD